MRVLLSWLAGLVYMIREWGAEETRQTDLNYEWLRIQQESACQSAESMREELRYRASKDFADTMAIAPVWKRHGGRDD